MRHHIKLVILVAILLLIAPALFAQATRTWVSGVGDDANPCSRTAPCKTFAGAISKTATGGEISVLDPGGYGAVTIVKSITINGEGTLAGILCAGTPSCVIVNSASAVVTLRNLQINGGSTGVKGVRVLAAAQVNIDNCDIWNFTSYHVEDARTTAGHMTITNTNIHTGIGSNSYGIVVEPIGVNVRNSLLLENVHITGMGASGLYVGNNARAQVLNSTFNANTFEGVRANQGVAGGTAEINLQNCAISANGEGLKTVGAGAAIRIAECFISDNRTNGLNIGAGTVIATYSNNYINGNTGNNGAGLTGTGVQ